MALFSAPEPIQLTSLLFDILKDLYALFCHSFDLVTYINTHHLIIHKYHLTIHTHPALTLDTYFISHRNSYRDNMMRIQRNFDIFESFERARITFFNDAKISKLCRMRIMLSNCKILNKIETRVGAGKTFVPKNAPYFTQIQF